MKKLLKNFKNQFLETLLTFLWSQWCALGVAGTVQTKNDWVTDPEAMLIFTCTFGRYEARLFDEVIDWLNVNGKFINIQRLKKLTHREGFSGVNVLAAIAKTMSAHHKSLKWKGVFNETTSLYHAQPLFFSREGEPMTMFGEPEPVFKSFGLLRGKLELRGHTRPVPVISNAGLLIKLRALFAIGSRAEIILYLLTHELGAHPSLIARETGYSQKTIQDTLVDMVQSGLIHVSIAGKRKDYYLKMQEWTSFLRLSAPVRWINWSSLLGALEKIWLKINEPGFTDLDPLVIASELRTLTQEVRPKIEDSGFLMRFADEKVYHDESYLSVFLSDLRNFLGIMGF